MQLKILRLLAAGESQPLDSRDIAKLIGVRFVGVSTTRQLAERGFIKSTKDGWIITEAGRVRISEEDK